jgi:hypothetical protein
MKKYYCSKCGSDKIRMIEILNLFGYEVQFAKKPKEPKE